MAREQKKPITTPKARFMFPKITEPDYGTKEYPDADGSYNVRLVFDADSPEAKGLLAKLKPLHDEAIAEGEERIAEMTVAARKKLEKENGKKLVKVNDLFDVLYDKETEEETGEIAFRFKTKASGEFKRGPKAGERWKKNLPLYDASGKLMVKKPDIWGGTVGKVSFTTRPYFIKGSGAVGLSLQLEAVQVIELVSGGARAASDFGFGEEEGYTHDETALKDDEDETSDEFTDETSDEIDDAEGDF